jgi:hypothetical protein
MIRRAENLSSGRDQNDGVFSILPVAVIPLAVPSSLRFKNALVLKMKQRVDAVRALDVNVPSFASITTAWAALWNKLLAPERETAVSPAAGDYLNLCAIDKQFRNS